MLPTFWQSKCLCHLLKQPVGISSILWCYGISSVDEFLTWDGHMLSSKWGTPAGQHAMRIHSWRAFWLARKQHLELWQSAQQNPHILVRICRFDMLDHDTLWGAVKRNPRTDWQHPSDDIPQHCRSSTLLEMLRFCYLPRNDLCSIWGTLRNRLSNPSVSELCAMILWYKEQRSSAQKW